MGNLIKKEFEGNEVEIIMIEDSPYFELYSSGAALGYVKFKDVKGITYKEIRKSRIDRIVKNVEISMLVHGAKKFVNVDGLRKFISLCNTKNKGKFIDWLKDNNYISQKEVFEYARKEDVFMDALSRILVPIGYTLEIQKIENNYRFDGYIPEIDMIVEYDENGHLHYDLNKESERDLYIKSNFSHTVRVTDFCDLMTNIGIVMNKILEVA